MMFCDICGVEILCDEELGKTDKRRSNIAGQRHTTTTVYCVDCFEDNEPVKGKVEDTE